MTPINLVWKHDKLINVGKYQITKLEAIVQMEDLASSVRTIQYYTTIQ